MLLQRIEGIIERMWADEANGGECEVNDVAMHLEGHMSLKEVTAAIKSLTKSSANACAPKIALECDGITIIKPMPEVSNVPSEEALRAELIKLVADTEDEPTWRELKDAINTKFNCTKFNGGEAAFDNSKVTLEAYPPREVRCQMMKRPQRPPALCNGVLVRLRAVCQYPSKEPQTANTSFRAFSDVSPVPSGLLSSGFRPSGIGGEVAPSKSVCHSRSGTCSHS